MGRSLLTFACIAVVVAFLMSSRTYQHFLDDLAADDSVHTRAVLAEAGVFTHDQQAREAHAASRTWLMALSALICFVGITNTMLMSVTERIREIGTLKCLGAVDSLIVRLFLVESLLVGAAGGLTGGVAGYLLGLFQTGAVLEFSLISWPRALGALLSEFPVSVAAGIGLTVVAAIYPAYVAARMRPADAMRTEI